jgi:hypothetical protein
VNGEVGGLVLFGRGKEVGGELMVGINVGDSYVYDEKIGVMGNREVKLDEI